MGEARREATAGETPARRGVPALVAALALPAVALLELAAEVHVAASPPDAAAWDAVAREVRALAGDGTLVVASPRWVEPHLRQRLGDDVMPLAHLGRGDTTRFAGAVEVALGEARSAELGAFRAVEEREVGPFVVRRLDNPAPDAVVLDLVEAWRPPHASVTGTDPAVRCPWSTRAPVVSGGLGGHPTLPRQRFDCPGPVWMDVGVTVIADERFRPRRCIWAHPFASGDKILRWEEVPLAAARRLVGHHGMYWVIERDGEGADVTVEARVDGVSIGTAVHRDGDGWAGFTFDLPARDPARPTGTVEIAIRTSDADRRHLCLEATLR